jgi:hypothetical protein
MNIRVDMLPASHFPVFTLLFNPIRHNYWLKHRNREKEINQKTTETSSTTTTTREKHCNNHVKNQKSAIASTSQSTHSKTHILDQNHTHKP